MLRAIHTSESRSATEVTARRVRATLDDMKLSKLGEWIAATVGETLTYHQFPAKHWRKIRTNSLNGYGARSGVARAWLAD